MPTAVINRVKELLKMKGGIDEDVVLQKWVTLFLQIQRYEMLEGSCCREQ